MKRSFQTLVVALGFVMIVAICVPAEAQRGGRGQGGRGQGGFGQGGFGGFGGGGSYVGLIQNEGVQEEIDLIEEQLGEIQEIQQDMRAEMQEIFADLRGGGGDVDREAIQEKMAELTEDMQNDIEDVLLEEQIERLKEIFIQVQGVRALTNADVQDDLDLNGSQKDEIEETVADFREKQRELFGGFGRGGRGGDGGGGRGNFEEIREKMTELQEEQNEALMNVLTGKQKDAFEEMKGEPYEGLDELRQGGRGGRGGQGRGGRGGRGGGDRERPDDDDDGGN